MLNDSIGVSSEGTFDVVWSGMENVKGDGVLFTLRFAVADGAKPGEYEIALSYSQLDTFNEKWEDVKLDSKTIMVSTESGENERTSSAGGEPTHYLR